MNSLKKSAAAAATDNENMGVVMTTPIADFVQKYVKADMSRFHMPGHKGQPLVGCESFDITEVAGADALYEADGIIAESEANATALFGSGHTFYSTEGSSLCIRAMIFLAVQAWKARQKAEGSAQAQNQVQSAVGSAQAQNQVQSAVGSVQVQNPAGAAANPDAAPARAARPVILAARNAHKAFLYACALTDADVHWLYPELGAAANLESGASSDGAAAENSGGASAGTASICSCPITVNAAETAIQQILSRTGSLPAALYVTSPDYLGGSQDLSHLSALCRRYDIPFLVDNAHGAYLKFLPEPCHPMDLGASMCCDSAHKTLPVLTGGAYLHISKDFPLDHLSAARQALALFGSTSPSYLVLQSLDLCNAKLAGTWPQELTETIRHADHLKENLRVLGYRVAQTEPLKITLLTDPAVYSGDALADALRTRQVECEHSDSESCIFMFTPENPPRDFDRLLDALTALAPEALGIASESPIGNAKTADYVPLFRPAPAPLSIREAVFAPSRSLPLEESLGCICAAPVVSCPPAIPIAVSGEVITENTIQLFRHYGIETVRVVL